MSTKTRYIVDYDPGAQFEECNGEARPLTEAEYAEAQYRGCPDHPRGHETSRVDNGRAWCVCGKEYADIPYAEYLAYYGNPDRHVYVDIIRQDQCPCCGSWVFGDSLGRIDFMDDSPEAGMIGTFTLAELPGYLHDVALGLDAAELHDKGKV